MADKTLRRCAIWGCRYFGLCKLDERLCTKSHAATNTNSACGAGDSIKPWGEAQRNPGNMRLKITEAREAADSIKPGVEPQRNPGNMRLKITEAREAADRRI